MSQYMSEFITAIIAGFAGWFFERKRKKAELLATRADSSQKIMDLYQEALDDLKNRYEERLGYLKAEYDERLRKLTEAMDAILKKQVADEKKYQELKKKYQELKAEFENYKKNNGEKN